MGFEISKPVAANGAAGENDARAAKKILNRLGHYTPYEKTGITDIPDTALFAGIRKFQKEHGLATTGAMRRKKSPTGFISGWKLSDGQIQSLLRNRKLGGGK